MASVNTYQGGYRLSAVPLICRVKRFLYDLASFISRVNLRLISRYTTYECKVGAFDGHAECIFEKLVFARVSPTFKQE